MRAIIELSISEPISLYSVPRSGGVSCFIASTSQTRAICSDPFIVGVRYTELLREAGVSVLRSLDMPSRHEGFGESSIVVLNILRGGLAYGLREALHTVYGWNVHRTAFISSQRARDDNGEWYITENRYQKISLPDNAHIILGDIVATGVSLEHALRRILDVARQQHTSINGFTFFTVGGMRAIKIMEAIDKECRALFPRYAGSTVIYYEGIFGLADETSRLSIVLPSTDFLHSPAVLTPEFIEYQTTALSYALERCTIYDSGSRAFDVSEHLADVAGYWQQVRELAQKDMTYTEYLSERFPEDPRLQDSIWTAEHATTELLTQVAEQQLAKTLV